MDGENNLRHFNRFGVEKTKLARLASINTKKLPSPLSVVRQILLVRNHRQDFLYAKKRNPGYD